jgi:hypothetical protein
MYVSSSTTGVTDFAAGGDISLAHSSGYGITDSAGLLAPGTTTPSIRDVSSGGGIIGSYKVSGLPANQGLSFSGFFDYQRDNVSLGTIAGLAAASAGSGQTDTYTFGGSFIYNLGPTYLKGAAAYDFGHGSEALSVDGSTGGYNTQGYSADLKLGHVFVLLNTVSSDRPSMPTKAPPKAAGGYIVGLDLSGHLGYSNQQSDGFTDSSGFTWGTDRTRYGEVGGSAKLFALIPSNGLLWMPYIAGTVDREFGFSSVLNIPTQAALVGGDVLSLQEAQTFWGTELGISVRGQSGLTFGVNGFYQASTDTNIVGGSAFVKIPFDYFAVAKY